MAQERPDERFLGKYKLESSDSNFDAFLKEIGKLACVYIIQ